MYGTFYLFAGVHIAATLVALLTLPETWKLKDCVFDMINAVRHCSECAKPVELRLFKTRDMCTLVQSCDFARRHFIISINSYEDHVAKML